MSETVILSGEYSPQSNLTAGEQAAQIIRYERSRDPSLSRMEHDILAGYEKFLESGESLAGYDESLGFAMTAAVGLAANVLSKSKALKKIAGLFGKVVNKIKARIAKVKGEISALSPNDQAVVQAVTNVQADAQAGSAKYASQAMSQATGIPQPNDSPATNSEMQTTQYSAHVDDGKIFGIDKKIVAILAIAGIALYMKSHNSTPAVAR